MGGVCSTYWGEERYVQGFGGETPRNATIREPTALWENNVKGILKISVRGRGEG
jgi:hypothetical protein